jgi:hypothetical protein
MSRLSGACMNLSTAPRTASRRMVAPSSLMAIEPDWSNITWMSSGSPCPM